MRQEITVKRNWLAGTIALIIVLIVCLLLLLFLSRSDSNSANEKESTQLTIPVPVQQNCDCEIELLNQEITFLKSKISDRDSIIADLIKNCNKTKKQPAKSVARKTKTQPVVKATLPVPVTQTVIVPAPQQETEYLTVKTVVPKSQIFIEDKEQKFCIKFAERMYWPYLAVQLGEVFPEIVDNGIGGYDLYLRPEGTIGSGGKDYGITQDGVYWIRSSRLSNWADRTPYFINKNGIFIQGTLSGEYWTAK